MAHSSRARCPPASLADFTLISDTARTSAKQAAAQRADDACRAVDVTARAASRTPLVPASHAAAAGAALRGLLRQLEREGTTGAHAAGDICWGKVCHALTVASALSQHALHTCSSHRRAHLHHRWTHLRHGWTHGSDRAVGQGL